MTIYTGSDCGCLIADGCDLLPASPQIAIHETCATDERTALGDDDARFVATEIDGTMEHNCFYDDAAQSVNDFLHGASPNFASLAVVCFAPGPATAGKRIIAGTFNVAGEMRHPQKGKIHTAVLNYEPLGEPGIEDGVTPDGIVTVQAAGNGTAYDTAVVPVTISAISVANPTIITTSVAHNFLNRQWVTIAGSDSTPSANGLWQITVIDATHFSIPLNVTGAGTAGTATRSGGTFYIEGLALVLGGYTSWTVKLQDSADNGTYADVTGVTQNLTAAPVGYALAFTGPLRRWVRVLYVLNGTGSSPSLQLLTAVTRRTR